MDSTLYVGLSRQMTLRRALEVTANNIANADTAGFKVEQLMFETDPATPMLAPGADPIAYVVDNVVARDFRQGVLETTGRSTDVAIEGDGFFTVQTAAGPRYTRDGKFGIDAQNRLVTKDGDAVLGAGGQPITVDPRLPPLQIGQDGTVTQDDQVIGRLGVARFASNAVLSKQGDNLFAAPPDVQPVQAPDAVVRQGAVEKSNVQPVLEITNLIEITRAYEQVAKMMDQTQELARTAVERLGRSS